MRAPTHITGPDGEICAKGAEIPADWFVRVPDLRAVIESLGPAAAAPEVEATTETAAAVPVEATVTMKRNRTTS